jgi:hypothetical protein
MLTLLNEKIDIQPIIDQVNSLGDFKRLELNNMTKSFFNDPWQVKDEFVSTPIGDALELLGNIGQARLLKLDSQDTYTAHYDPDDRIHLAITTNEHSYLIDLDDQKLYHLPVDGNFWYMDTGKMHVAVNWGASPRIHLNIRVLLPRLDWFRPYIKFTVTSDNYDWKQQSYLSIMKLVNRKVKEGVIFGFHSVNERQLYLNTDDFSIFDCVMETLRAKNIDFLFETYDHKSSV